MFRVTWHYAGTTEAGSESFESRQEAEVFYWEGVNEALYAREQDRYRSSIIDPEGQVLRYFDDTFIGATLVW